MNMLEAAFVFFVSSWMIVSFFAPTFWAAVNVLDIYFVRGIYEDEMDGIIVSSLFQMIPWIFLPFVVTLDFSFLGEGESIFQSLHVWLAFLGGMLFSASFFFYFKALFSDSDVSLLQVLWNLAIVVVPILAFLFYGEQLLFAQYGGMGVVLFGATLLSFSSKIRRKLSSKYFWIMAGAIILLSLSMVTEDRAYLGLSTGNSDGFWTGFLFFSLGDFFAGALFWISSGKNILPLVRKHYKIFALAEGLSFVGTMASQRAISLAPSVSYVATIETFVPVFIIIHCLIISIFFLYFKKDKAKVAAEMLADSLDGKWIKVAATAVMALGVYMLNSH